MTPAELSAIFSFSFLMALTGALSPGPLFTYTIIKSARAEKRGYLIGLWIIVGHAILELGVIVLLLAGFSFILHNPTVVAAIGLGGGVILIWFGMATILEVRRGGRGISLACEPGGPDPASGRGERSGVVENPVIGGILVSMSNPYWWIWWATIGLALISQFNLTWESWPGLLAFFLGHEAGDLLWYLLVSTLSFFGVKKIGPRAYSGIMLACGVFLILFGLYLGVSPLLK